MYIGVDGAAHKVKKAYIGADALARKIKKGYIGVGGVARPFLSGGELAYHGNETRVRRGYHAGASVGGCAILAGGQNYSGARANADVYDKDLVYQTILYTARTRGAGASTPNHALFAGGEGSSSSSSGVSSVQAFDSDLAASTISSISKTRTRLGGASVGNYAIFAGGVAHSDGQWATTVDVYDDELNKVTTSQAITKSSFFTNNISNNMNATTGISNTAKGRYATFVGNQKVESFDSTLVKTTHSNLSVARGCHAGATAGGYTLIAGGAMDVAYHECKSLNTVDVYSDTMTKLTNLTLSLHCVDLASISMGDYAVFAGGAYLSYDGNDEDGYSMNMYERRGVHAYDSNLLRMEFADIAKGGPFMASAATEEYGFFSGGYYNRGYKDTLYNNDVNIFAIK